MVTRLDGAPWMLRTPGISRIVFRISAKSMRRGFDGLLTLAQEQPAAPRRRTRTPYSKRSRVVSRHNCMTTALASVKKSRL